MPALQSRKHNPMYFKDVTPADLLSELPPSLSEILAGFLSENAPLDTVGQTLVGSQYIGVALKGGSRFVGDLWMAVKNEFRIFLCTDDAKYSSIRSGFTELTKENKSKYVAYLSGAIGGFLGVQAGLVTPLLVWLLVAAITVGKEATCAVLAKAMEPPKT